MSQLFKFKSSKTKADGVLVEEYVPLKNIYVDSINMNNGKIERKKVTLFTVHKNVKVYYLNLGVPENSFYGTADHGYIVYHNGVYKKVNLDDLLANKDKYYFIKYVDNHTIFLSLDKLTVEKTDLTTAYDFTVEDNYTFLVNDIAVYDTMSIYSVMLNKSNEELENILDPVLQIHPGKWIYLIDETVTGAYEATKDEPDENNVTRVFRTKQEFLEAVGNTYSYVIENYSDTVQIETTVNTVGRFFYQYLLKLRNKLTRPLNKNLLQYYLTKLYYSLVAKQIIDKADKVQRKKSFMEFQKITSGITRISSKIMNGMPLSLTTLLDSTVDIIKEYENELMNCEKGKENQLIKIYKDKIKQANSRFSGENKLTKVADQMLLSRGYVINYDNKKVFIQSSYMKGLKDSEIFESAQSNRNGAISKVISVSDAGYLFRKLVFATSHIVTSDSRIDDCNTENYLSLDEVKTDLELFRNFLFRWIVVDNEEYFLDFDAIQKLSITYKNKIPVSKVRSPIYCTEDKFCKKCLPPQYTYLSNHIGILSSQSLCEDLAQDLMRQFHTGGKVDEYGSINNDVLLLHDNTLIAKVPVYLHSIELSSERNELVVTYEVDGKVNVDTIYNVEEYIQKVPSDSLVEEDSEIVSFKISKVKITTLVRNIDKVFQSRKIDNPLEIYSYLKDVNCQSLYKEIICQSFYYTSQYEFARKHNYQDSIKYSLNEIPYFNKLTGLCFGNLNSSFRNSKNDNKISSSFFNSIVTNNMKLLQEDNIWTL